MDDVNPRANGFNYGTGWGRSPKPDIYAEAQQLALDLGEIAVRASKTAWALEMAIRNVRLAETDAEKRCEVLALKMEMDKHREVPSGRITVKQRNLLPSVGVEMAKGVIL